MTDRKRCSQCGMPDVEGTLYVLDAENHDELWCGGCLRNEVVRLRGRAGRA